MSTSAKKSARTVPAPAARSVAKGARPGIDEPARASQLRAQIRKLLAKHYRAKYGVR